MEGNNFSAEFELVDIAIHSLRSRAMVMPAQLSKVY